MFSLNSPNHGKGLCLQGLDVTYRVKLIQRVLSFIGGIDRLVSAIENNECIEWQGKGGSNGYGQIKLSGVMTSAHKLVYALLVGTVPQGQVVMHTCDNPRCCNPNHLRLGTQADNLRDASAKGRLRRVRRVRFSFVQSTL